MTKKYFAVVVVAVLALGTGYLFLRAADKPVAAPTGYNLQAVIR